MFKSKRRPRKIESVSKGKWSLYPESLSLPKYQYSKPRRQNYVFFVSQALFSLICLAGFSYQCSQVLMYYLAYPTRMESVTSYYASGMQSPPAITLTNNNLFVKSYLHKVVSNLTTNDISYNSLGYWQHYELKNSLSQNQLNLSGHSLKSLIINCSDLSVCREEATWSWGEYWSNAFTLYANFTGKAKKMISMEKREISEKQTLIQMEIGFDPEEYSVNANDTKKLGARIRLHSSYDILTFGIQDTKFNMMSLTPGKNYFISINQETYVYLPPPYWTNCRNYEEEFDAKKEGPLSRLLCIREYHMNKALKICGCIPIYYNYLTHLTLAVTEDVEAKKCPNFQKSEECMKMVVENETNYNYNCIKKICRRECRKVVYEVHSESTTASTRDRRRTDDGPPDSDDDQPPYMRDISGENQRHRRSFRMPNFPSIPDFSRKQFPSTCFVNIQYGSPKTTTITYEVQYKLNNLVADLGGFLGLWLGFSALSIPKVILQTLVLLRTCTQNN